MTVEGVSRRWVGVVSDMGDRFCGNGRRCPPARCCPAPPSITPAPSNRHRHCPCPTPPSTMSAQKKHRHPRLRGDDGREGVWRWAKGGTDRGAGCDGAVMSGATSAQVRPAPTTVIPAKAGIQVGVHGNGRAARGVDGHVGHRPRTRVCGVLCGGTDLDPRLLDEAVHNESGPGGWPPPGPGDREAEIPAVQNTRERMAPIALPQARTVAWAKSPPTSLGKGEIMPQDRPIVGIDVSKDRLDVHIVPGDRRCWRPACRCAGAMPCRCAVSVVNRVLPSRRPPCAGWRLRRNGGR